MTVLLGILLLFGGAMLVGLAINDRVKNAWDTISA